MKKIIALMFVMAMFVSTAFAQDEVTVAYFLGWATPNQIAQVEKVYDEAMGAKVNWVAFDTGVEMSTAMQAGDVDIAYSQGATPFALAVSSGVPIKAVGIALEYLSSNDCIVGSNSGITKDNAADLAGQTVSVPVGTMADYEFRVSMGYLGVDIGSMNIVDQAPPDGAVSLEAGDVAMACGYGDALFSMRESGDSLLSQADKDAAGIVAFDIISVTDDFAANHPEQVVQFLQVTENMNRAYEASLVNDAIAAAWHEQLTGPSGMELENLVQQVSGFNYLTAREQLSTKWLGGDAVDTISLMAQIFDDAGEITALDDYGPTIDLSFLQQVE